MRPTYGLSSPAPFVLLTLSLLVDHGHRSAAATVELNAPIQRPQLSPGNSYLTNFCERQARVDDGTLPLPMALADLDISVHLVRWSPLHVRARADGELDYDNPGILVNLMDQLATRGKFRWRDSFGVGLTPGNDEKNENATFSQILEWALDTYDLSLGEWRNSVGRKAKGILFPLGIADASLIMVQKAASTAFDPFAFLSGFTWQVWLAIVATYICSGLIYQFIHFYGEGEHIGDRSRMRMRDTMYEMGMAFNQQSIYTPRSNAGLIFVFAINTFSLIIIASYTANLVTHMVLGQTAQYHANSFNEAQRKRIPICVWKDTSLHTYLRTTYPDAVLVKAESRELEYELLNAGKCDIVSDTVQSFQSKVREATWNSNCKLAIVGDPDLEQKAGIAVKGDGARCSSLLRDVLDYHLSDMNVEKVTQREWNRHQDLISPDFCPSEETEENAPPLGFKDLGGVFIGYAILVVIALIMCQYDHMKKGKTAVNRDSLKHYEPKDDAQDNTFPQEMNVNDNHHHKQQSTVDQFVSKEDLKEIFRQFKDEMIASRPGEEDNRAHQHTPRSSIAELLSNERSSIAHMF